MAHRPAWKRASSCPGEPARFISGISLITADREWLDVQRMKCGEDIAISVRRYEPVPDAPTPEDRLAGRAKEMARFQSGANLSIDEIIELNRKVAPEGVEALKEVAGSVDRVVGQLIGGIQSGMGYLGAGSIAQLREKSDKEQCRVAE